MEEMQPVKVDWQCKLLLIGDSAVGKTCLLRRFTKNEFSQSFVATIGIDFMVRTLKIQGKVIKVQIWDTSGQEKFQSITTAYYRGANGVLIVYDITRLQSFENVENWISSLQRRAGYDVEKTILGNKCDMESERVVLKEDGENLAKNYSVEFSETSAKTNVNVESAFIEIISRVVAKKYADLKAQEEMEENIKIHERAESRQESISKCCKS